MLVYCHFVTARGGNHTFTANRPKTGGILIVIHIATHYLSFPSVAKKRHLKGPIALKTPSINQYKPVSVKPA